MSSIPRALFSHCWESNITEANKILDLEMAPNATAAASGVGGNESIDDMEAFLDMSWTQLDELMVLLKRSATLLEETTNLLETSMKGLDESMDRHDKSMASSMDQLNALIKRTKSVVIATACV